MSVSAVDSDSPTIETAQQVTKKGLRPRRTVNRLALALVGVKAAIQPYGSDRDRSVIKAANECEMAMPATLERCFIHD